MLAVDDVQWLDRSSAAMLEFAGRRLRKEPVALLLARRQSSRLDSERLELAIPEERRLAVRVGPLSMGALHRLLRDRLGIDARAAGPAQGARGVRGKPLLRTGARQGVGALWRLDPTGPSPARARDTGGNPPRTHRRPAPERASSPRRGGGIEAADRVDARRLARAGAGIRGGLDRAHERRGHASRTRCSLRPPTARSPPRSGGVCTAGSPRSSPIRRSGPGTWRWAPRGRTRRSPMPSRTPRERAAARGAPAAAAELAELAVRLTPKSERGRLLERQSTGLGITLPPESSRRPPRCSSSFEELSPGVARADALLLLASAQQSFEQSLELAERALGDARGDDARVAKLECYIGEILLVQGSADRALEHARAALEPAERAADRTILATALSTVAWFETLSAVEPTPGLLERAVVLEEAAVQSGVYDTSSPSFALGMRLMFAGRLDEARARMDMLARASGLARRRSRGGGCPPSPGRARVPRRQLVARRAEGGGGV